MLLPLRDRCASLYDLEEIEAPDAVRLKIGLPIRVLGVFMPTIDRHLEPPLLSDFIVLQEFIHFVQPKSGLSIASHCCYLCRLELLFRFKIEGRGHHNFSRIA